jgi:hypothetical protein
MSVTTQAGDVVVVYAANENDTSGTIDTPSGNGVTFTLQGSLVGSNYCEVYVWSGTDTTGGTNWTLTLTRTAGNSQNWGGTASVFRNAAPGLGVSDSQGIAFSNGADLTSITTTAANSAVVVMFADWDANSDVTTSRVWQTINGNTPTSGNGMELTYAYVNGAYTVFGAYYPDVAAAGAKSVGLASGSPNAGSGTRHIAFVAIEVQGASPPVVNGLSWFTYANSIDPPLTTASNFFGRYDFPAGNSDDMTGNGNDSVPTPGSSMTTDRKGVANNAYNFDGSGAYAYTFTSFSNPTTYSANAWFRTNSSAGGVIVGFGNNQFSSMTSYDRVLYLDTSGRVNFGAYETATSTAHVITSASSYNDNSWHMATMVMSPSTGMKLYVDAVSVGTDANTASENYTGWWHIAYNNLSGWPNGAAESWTGDLDDIWIYNIALTSTQVTQLYGI